MFRMSRGRGEFGYGSLSSSEFTDHRSLVTDPRGEWCADILC